MKILRVFGLILTLLFVSITQLPAQSGKSFTILQFPEGRTVKTGFLSSGQIPGARMEAEVKFQDGQFRIEIKFEDMKSAVLFGGDVTCYVLWAINRDGAPENLGELWVRPESDNDTVRFSTGLRNFALAVTGEKFYQVSKPSEMVLFWNDRRPDPPIQTETLVYEQFAPAPGSGVSSLENVRYDGKKPLDLVQAEKVFKFAEDLGAEELAFDLFSQASLALRQAAQVYERNQGRGAQRFARDSVAASNEAMRLTARKLELMALEEEYRERQAQMAELEQRASKAEEQVKLADEKVQASQEMLRKAEAEIVEVQKQRAQAENEVALTQNALKELKQERENLAREKDSLTDSLKSLNEERVQLEQEKASLLEEKQKLEEDKETLQGRLQQALSQVADTHSSARGIILNLPDILFSVGEAELKPETELVLAKLSGILLMMQDLNLRIEGHTDSTGAPSFNMRLSQRRADAVFDFLALQGITSTRMKTAGYGMDRPIAENNTAEGRRQNRRVEIIIAEGEIASQ